MCYGSLVDGDAVERPLVELLRGELPSALKDGTAAAAVVLAVLLINDVGPPLIVGATAGAFLLGIALYQAVLVAGVALLRWWTSDRTEPADAGAGTPESVW